MTFATDRILEVLNEIEPTPVALAPAEGGPKPMDEVLKALVPKLAPAQAVSSAPLTEAEQQCAVAEQTASVRYYRPLGHSRIPLLTGLRRAVRRFLEYIFAPMIEDAVAHNAAVTRTLRALCDNGVELQRQCQADATAEDALRCMEGEICALRGQMQQKDAAITALQQETKWLRERLGRIVTDTESAQMHAFRAARQKPAPVGAVSCDAQKVQGEAVTLPEAEPSDVYTRIDYFNFENHFRGSRFDIRCAQEFYLPYFAGKKNVLDLGCGRGEFLELMRTQGIPATGVDLYPEYVEFCKAGGLDAVQGDAVQMLRAAEAGSFDGIFVSQLVEHLSTDDVVALCRLGYEKLAPGGVMILETPNPQTLAIFTHAFYIDPSHQKPVHPQTLQYFLQEAGFASLKLVHPPASRLGDVVPHLEGPGISNLEYFNSGMDRLTELLYGNQDYAIVAIK